MARRIDRIGWALSQNVRGNESRLLIILAYHSNNAGVCWVGKKRMAKMMQVKKLETVRVLLKKLADKGLIERHFREGKSTLYRLRFSGENSNLEEAENNGSDSASVQGAKVVGLPSSLHSYRDTPSPKNGDTLKTGIPLPPKTGIPLPPKTGSEPKKEPKKEISTLLNYEIGTKREQKIRIDGGGEDVFFEGEKGENETFDFGTFQDKVSELEKELKKRGVGLAKVVVRDYSIQLIEKHIEIYDWHESEGRRKGGGWLYRSILEDYPTPRRMNEKGVTYTYQEAVKAFDRRWSSAVTWDQMFEFVEEGVFKLKSGVRFK